MMDGRSCKHKANRAKFIDRVQVINGRFRLRNKPVPRFSRLNKQTLFQRIGMFRRNRKGLGRSRLLDFT